MGEAAWRGSGARIWPLGLTLNHVPRQCSPYPDCGRMLGLASAQRGKRETVLCLVVNSSTTRMGTRLPTPELPGLAKWYCGVAWHGMAWHPWPGKVKALVPATGLLESVPAVLMAET